LKLSRQKVTLKDLAKRLNLSVVTVSRALNDHPDVSEATKARVLSMARKLNYHPNSIARSLVQKKTHTIGVIVPEIYHSFFSEVVSGVEEVASQAGYQIILCQSNEDAEKERKNIDTLLSKQVDGILISVAESDRDPQPFRSLRQTGTPFVFFDRYLVGVEAPRVIVDDVEGAQQLVEYLIQLGYQRIAHFAGYPQISIGRDRLVGYQKALAAHYIPVDPHLIIEGGFNERDGVVAMEEILTRGDLPEAIFAVNDPVAIGAYKVCMEKGIRVPEDVALVGFSDIDVSSLLAVPLTTMRQPALQIGQEAARLLIRINEGEEVNPSEEIVLKTELIVRRSCGSAIAWQKRHVKVHEGV